MFSASLFINQALGWNIYFGILLQLALTALCTALGNIFIKFYAWFWWHVIFLVKSCFSAGYQNVVKKQFHVKNNNLKFLVLYSIPQVVSQLLYTQTLCLLL